MQKMLLAHAERLRQYIDGKIPRGLRSVVSADDVLQDVWIAAFRTAGGFRGRRDADFEHWLTTIANRKTVDTLRIALAIKRGGGVPVQGCGSDPYSSIIDLVAGAAAPGVTPSRVTSAKEAAAAVTAALGHVSADRARAVRMRHIEGRPLSEIARLMQRTVPAVHSLIFHGLRELRTHLGSAEKFFSDALPLEEVSGD